MPPPRRAPLYLYILRSLSFLLRWPNTDHQMHSQPFVLAAACLLAAAVAQGPLCKTGAHPSVMAIAQSCAKGQIFCKDVQVDVVQFDMDAPAASMKVLHSSAIPNLPHKDASLASVLSASDPSNAYFLFPSPSPLLLTVPLSGTVPAPHPISIVAHDTLPGNLPPSSVPVAVVNATALMYPSALPSLYFCNTLAGTSPPTASSSSSPRFYLHPLRPSAVRALTLTPPSRLIFSPSTRLPAQSPRFTCPFPPTAPSTGRQNPYSYTGASGGVNLGSGIATTDGSSVFLLFGQMPDASSAPPSPPAAASEPGWFIGILDIGAKTLVSGPFALCTARARALAHFTNRIAAAAINPSQA